MCNALTVSLTPSCEALQKSGGLGLKVWIGLLADISAKTDGTGNSITALTFAASKGFITVSGKRYKNNAVMALAVGENKNLRTQAVNLVLYYNNADELAAIDTLLNAEGVCIFVQTNAGQIEAWGMNLGLNYQSFGLKASALDGGSGTALLDPNVYTLGMTGDHENLQLLFNDAATDPTTLTADIAYLDNLVI